MEQRNVALWQKVSDKTTGARLIPRSHVLRALGLCQNAWDWGVENLGLPPFLKIKRNYYLSEANLKLAMDILEDRSSHPQG